jgi:hypothetical protein
MSSPFPGMDPFLENPGLWPDVHNSLIFVGRELLTQQLRPRYYVRIEERIYVSSEEDPGREILVPDLRIAERLAPFHGKATQPAAALQVAEPENLVTLLDDEFHEPYLEVCDAQDRAVVAVIEVLSPSNKVPGSDGRASYQSKRAEILKSPSHWVEIDLLRKGSPTVPRIAGPYDYIVHASRAGERPKGLVWRILLSQRLPTINIPLKGEEKPAALDLQKALDLAYDRSGYEGMIDYRELPKVSLTEKQEAWADALLREKGLR